MNTFYNSDYSALIQDLIYESNYIKISNRSKLSKIRDYAEILVRKMLNIGNDTKIMLGEVRLLSKNSAIKDKLLSIDSGLKKDFINIVANINKLTRPSHHTQETREFTSSEVEKAEDLLLDLYSMLFIQYFIDIKVNLYTEPVVLTFFSILPPIIRYKTWNYLYQDNKSNIQVINKLCLSMIKTFDKQYALKWIADHECDIKTITYPSKEDVLRYKLIHKDKTNPCFCKISLDFESYNNVYDLLLCKINDSRSAKNESGKMYGSFEEAKTYFVKVCFVSEDSSTELVRLYDLMEFVYIGRKEE